MKVTGSFVWLLQRFDFRIDAHGRRFGRAGLGWLRWV